MVVKPVSVIVPRPEAELSAPKFTVPTVNVIVLPSLTSATGTLKVSPTTLELSEISELTSAVLRNALLMSAKEPEPPATETFVRVGVFDERLGILPLTVNDEPGAIVLAIAAGAIARAVAVASKARKSFFIVTSWGRPRGRLCCLSPLQRAGQGLNCSFNGLRVEVRTTSDATGLCARISCVPPGAYRLEFEGPGHCTPAGKEHSDPAFP